MFRTTAETPRLAHERVTVRHAHVGDAAAIHRLAALDSAPTPEGPMLVAESDARILAALPLGSGRAIADPFTRTSELVALLQLRAAQLEGEQAPRTSRLARLARALGRRRPAAARA